MQVSLAQTRQPAARVTTSKEYVTILFGIWLIGGIFIDGFAHNHGVVETFFTPWHAILYSGFLASAVWMGWLLLQSRHASGLPWTAAAPVGYGLGLVGVFIFLLGGLGDMYWHTVFGIEQNIAALLSPTHLILLLGALLILSSPFRASWHNAAVTKPDWRTFAPAFLSLVVTTGAVSFFLMYAWMFRYNLPAESTILWYNYQIGGGGLLDDMNKTRGISYILIDTIVYMFPVFLLMKRWTLPAGTMTALFTLVSVMMNVLDGFQNYPSIFVALGAGLVGDILYRVLRAGEGRALAERVIAAAVPIALWGFYFAWMTISDSIGWETEFWAGAIVEATLLSMGLQLLASKHAYASHQPPPARG
ncbi:hypothetical protein GZH47_22425 [Paenibacillus rhizovicinus]|uniref:Uncharacterized protein n=1 Tax=Paenibacillus rhizovicinus TaxID=2704463 RepID=A0A6C0P9R8_9BACL|nr:hypothetical protein [Paenibacillus rhizovicinus]QHW33272.1 hypothetical protein GZH47_22425 [Paenibacillus rhizovicinus]